MKHKHYRFRLPYHDYKCGAYFVTVCCKNRVHEFGLIENGIMKPNELGLHASQAWADLPDHFAHLSLHNFVIMPDHFHGLLHLEAPHLAGSDRSKNQFGPQHPKSLSNVMGSWKSGVTRWARRNGFEHFGWQARFHDRWIRNEQEFHRISAYIHRNPQKWSEDRRIP